MNNKILVVDDEPQVRDMLRQTLEKEGYEVTEANDGEEGVRVLKEQLVDLMITDIYMPKKEGLETMSEARKMNPSLKIIAISGGGKQHDLDSLLISHRFGANKVLPKPFSRKTLLQHIQELLKISPR